jgi:hypothetical protein
MEALRAFSTFVHGAANIPDLALPTLPRDLPGVLSLVVTVGLYVLVNRLGRKVEREHVKNGYGMLFGVVGIMVPVIVLWIASFKLGNLLINSALLMLLQPAILRVVVPVSKKMLRRQ